MKSLEERKRRKWGGGEEGSARWPERKLRRRPKAIAVAGGGCESAGEVEVEVAGGGDV